MRYYNVSYTKHGEHTETPFVSKQSAILKYITLLTIQSGYNYYSELKVLKHLKNGKVIDITSQVNNFLKS